MIKTEWGKTTIQGTGVEVLTDLNIIVSSIYKHMKKSGISEERAKEIILGNVNDAFNDSYESEFNGLDDEKDFVVDALKKIIEGLKEKEKKDE